MGSNDGDADEKPVHPVRLKSFAIGRYEVTFDEYDQFAEALGKPKPDDHG
jgi:formylglycine-generating enzyme required for sulfatase activity